MIILSDILAVNIDELLKDKKTDIHLKKSLPEWYSSLNSKSLSILKSALNIFLTGTMSKKRLNEFSKWEYWKLIHASKKVSPDLKEGLSQNFIQQGIEIFSGLIADFYFEIDDQEDKINIHTDKFFTFEEFIRKELEEHKKRHQIELVKNYLAKHKNLPADKLAEELAKVSDIGYRESAEPADAPYYYGEENIIYQNDEEIVKAELEDNETDCWNEIPYYVLKEENFLNSYKSKIGKTLTKNKCDKILQDCEKQIATVKNEYFSQLYEYEIIDFLTDEFDLIEFFDKDSSMSKYYLNVRIKFYLTEKAIKQILDHAFQERVDKNINKINRAISIEKEHAKSRVEFMEDYVGNVELGFRNILQDPDNKDKSDE